MKWVPYRFGGMKKCNQCFHAAGIRYECLRTNGQFQTKLRGSLHHCFRFRTTVNLVKTNPHLHRPLLSGKYFPKNIFLGKVPTIQGEV